MAINYVRFQRGTLAAYQALLEKGLIDDNTLYFIYADDSSTGSLYMGEKVISGGDTNYVFSTLNELSDVEVTNAESNSFLVKDSATNNWVAKTPAQVAELIQEYIENNNEEVINLDSDNLSVEIIDNIIQLKNYGSNYYAFIPAVKDTSGNIIEESKYVLTEGFKAGLEPRVEETNDGLVISWYEPNTEATDILANEIDKVRTSIEEVTDSLSALEELLNADNGLVTKVDNLENKVGSPSDTDKPATGLYQELEELLSIVDTKADASSVYTKEDTDKAIAAAITNADHLKRKIVNSIDDIDVTTPDAHLYIYMVPTGFQYEDDKYDEYVVIDGIVEKVGSWEVDLSNYATKDEIIINSVSNDFTINDKQLILNDLSINKIIGLQDLLNNKVDAIEGHSLLSPEDKAKLDKLLIDDDDNLEISGSVSAENVIGLEQWLNDKASSVKGLSENNLTDDLYEKISNILFITSVEETELNVDETGKLSILEIDQSKVTGLVDALNAKASQTSVEENKTLIQEIVDSLAYYTTLEQHNNDINELRDILIWKEM